MSDQLSDNRLGRLATPTNVEGQSQQLACFPLLHTNTKTWLLDEEADSPSANAPAPHGEGLSLV